MRVTLTLFGSLGDLHPFLGLAVELRRRGHEVVIATSRYHREAIEREHISFFPIGPDLKSNDPDLIHAVLHPFRGPEILHKRYIFPYLREVYEQFLPLARKSDVIVSGILGYHASIAAETLGIPWVSCLLSPICFWSAYEPPILAPIPWLGRMRGLGPSVHRPILRSLLYMAKSWAKPLQDLRHELHLPEGRNPFCEGQFSERLILAPFSKVLASPQPDWPSSAHVTGFVFYDGSSEPESLPQDLERFLSEGSQPIVFALGSTEVERPDRYWHECRRIAEKLRMRAVLMVGRSLFSDYASWRTPDLFIGDYAPYTPLFRRASLVVHQGGVGTTARAMISGHPMLVLPSVMDQFDNAERVKRAGVAAVLSRKRFSSSRAVRLIAESLASSAMAEKAAEVRATIMTELGARGCADAIESL